MLAEPTYDGPPPRAWGTEPVEDVPLAVATGGHVVQPDPVFEVSRMMFSIWA